MPDTLIPRATTKSRVLVIDDMEANVLLLQAILEKSGYEVIGCREPLKAASIVQAEHPDLVLLDLHMPQMNGYELLSILRRYIPDPNELPILVFTADVSPQARLQALEYGANDFLTKPGDATEIVLRVRNFLHSHHMHMRLQSFSEALETKVDERTRALWESQIEVVERLARVGELRDDQTGEHAKRVGEMSGRIATLMGLSKTETELIRLAAPLHDIGKVGIPDSILLKRGSLLDAERREMMYHAQIGAEILSGGKTALIQTAEVIALTHHERWDGKGYPKGLFGQQIPISGRIVAIADVFDALTSDRPYKKASTRTDAVAYIIAQSGKHFDPAVVDAFLRVIAQDYPAQLAA